MENEYYYNGVDYPNTTDKFITVEKENKKIGLNLTRKS